MIVIYFSLSKIDAEFLEMLFLYGVEILFSPKVVALFNDIQPEHSFLHKYIRKLKLNLKAKDQ